MKKEQYHSCLEFGAIDLENQQKQVWALKTGQSAYDWFMCARYLNDLLTYVEMQRILELGPRRLHDCLDLFLEKVHHSEDLALNLDKWIALRVAKDHLSDCRKATFYELGSTLFGCIEALEFIDTVMKSVTLETLNCKSLHWLGVDNSDYLNGAAKQLHQSYKITLFEDFNEVEGLTDVFFAKGVSLLYALDKAADFEKLLTDNRIALFDYSFANNSPFTTTIGTGKLVNYITKEAFISNLPSGKVCYSRKDKIKRGSDTCFYELLVGSNKAVEGFIAEQYKAYESLAKILSIEQQQLFFRNSLKNIAWQPL